MNFMNKLIIIAILINILDLGSSVNLIFSNANTFVKDQIPVLEKIESFSSTIQYSQIFSVCAKLFTMYCLYKSSNSDFGSLLSSLTK